MYIVKAFVSTIVIGFLADSIFGNWLNWPDAGAIFAIAVMGAFILAYKGRDE